MLLTLIFLKSRALLQESDGRGMQATRFFLLWGRLPEFVCKEGAGSRLGGLNFLGALVGKCSHNIKNDNGSYRCCFCAPPFIFVWVQHTGHWSRLLPLGCYRAPRPGPFHFLPNYPSCDMYVYFYMYIYIYIHIYIFIPLCRIWGPAVETQYSAFLVLLTAPARSLRKTIPEA